MPLVFYVVFFNLSSSAREEFEFLVEEGVALEDAIANCANLWRSKMLGIYKDPILCRHVFLARSVLIAVKAGIKNGCGVQTVCALTDPVVRMLTKSWSLVSTAPSTL